MMQRLNAWYIALTQRERTLVGIAAALAALVLLVYGLVLPLGHALDMATTRHREATDRAGRIVAGLETLKRALAARSAGLAGPLDQAAEASAQEAGFVVQSRERRGADSVVLAIASARPSAVLAWLDGLEQEGLTVEQVTMTPAPDGSVSVSVALRKAGA